MQICRNGSRNPEPRLGGTSLACAFSGFGHDWSQLRNRSSVVEMLKFMTNIGCISCRRMRNAAVTLAPASGRGGQMKPAAEPASRTMLTCVDDGIDQMQRAATGAGFSAETSGPETIHIHVPFSFLKRQRAARLTGSERCAWFLGPRTG
jgi:hypothetical protein